MAEPAVDLARPRLRCLERADPRLVALLDGGHPVLLVARCSESGGRKAVQSAVNQVYAAARGLAVHGVDVRHLLPEDHEELEAEVWANLETVVSRTIEGAKFTNKFFFTDFQ